MINNLVPFLKFCFIVAVRLPSHVWLFATPWTGAHQASLSLTISWSCQSSCPLNQWCHPTISSSVAPFSSYPQSFPVSGSFPCISTWAWISTWALTPNCATKYLIGSDAYLWPDEANFSPFHPSPQETITQNTGQLLNWWLGIRCSSQVQFLVLRW